MKFTISSSHRRKSGLGRVHLHTCCLAALVAVTLGGGCNSASTPRNEASDASKVHADSSETSSSGSLDREGGTKADAGGMQTAQDDAGGAQTQSTEAGSTPSSSLDASMHDADSSLPVEGGNRDASTSLPEDAAAPEGDPNHALLEQARADYRSWEPRTDAPVHISEEIFTLCRTPTPAEDAFVESVHGNELALQDWLNPAARQTLSALEGASSDAGMEPSVFVVGATIVKEKLVRRGAEYELAALGFMIKREPGFDASHGDWQFGYWDALGGYSSSADAQTYCGGCHALSATDFVYADDSWRFP